MKDASAMQHHYTQYLPAQGLEDHVKFFYYFHSDDTRPERILPIGTTEITVALDNGYEDIYINNPATRSYFVKPKALNSVVGVCLHPWAVNSLFKIPQSAISDSKLLLRDVLITPYNKLSEQLKGKTNHLNILQLMQNYLLSISEERPNAIVMDAIKLIDQRSGTVDMDTLYKRYNLSERRLQQLFNITIGMSPKKYCRLKRFHRAVSKLTFNSNLTDLGLNSGYYDQSHFIHEFSSFAGIGPGGFLKEQNTLSDINTKAYFTG